MDNTQPTSGGSALPLVLLGAAVLTGAGIAVALLRSSRKRDRKNRRQEARRLRQEPQVPWLPTAAEVRKLHAGIRRHNEAYEAERARG